MENQEIVVVKKKHTVLKVIGIVLAVAAVCVVAYKVYQKFFKKKNEELEEGEELDALNATAEDEAACLEVTAEAVIANAEDMEEIPAE